MNIRVTGILLLAFVLPCRAGDVDEFKVKREAVFEFVQRPQVSRAGDAVTISFESRGFCDATVAVEDRDGRIVRHLVSGVLGDNAPAPFQKKSRKQVVVWDGKNDQGKYVEDLASHTVRVSLGLRAEFEKSLFHSPYKRIGRQAPRLCAAPEGIYVADGYGVQFLRLFGHDGTYVRTIYPFPADSLDDVVGLKRREMANIGSWPVKYNYQQASLLTAATGEKHRLAVEGELDATYGDRQHYRAAGPDSRLEIGALAVCGRRIALADLNLNRLATGGGTPRADSGQGGGLPLTGQQTCLNISDYTSIKLRHEETPFRPTSAAFSPDGRTLYLTGYVANYAIGQRQGIAAHAVMKLDYAAEGKLELFAGSLKKDDHGNDNAHLKTPTSVACDAAGRVYVSDYAHHRVQVFAPDGTWLKSIAVPMPAKVMVHQRTGEIWVCAFPSIGVPNDVARDDDVLKEASTHFMWAAGSYEPTLTRFGPFDNPQKLSTAKLPAIEYANVRGLTQEQAVQIELDSWSEKPALWVVNRLSALTQFDIITVGQKLMDMVLSRWVGGGVRVLVEQDGKWQVQTDFARLAAATVKRLAPPDNGIQRLGVNPRNGRVYILEHQGPRKSNNELIEADPATGQVARVKLPFRAEDFCFDYQGWIYLRTDREVVRYDSTTWREVPWDYGEERKVGFDGEPGDAVSALPIPAARPMWFHMGGMSVSPTGHLAVVCPNEPKRFERANRADEKWKGNVQQKAVAYAPRLYPGRYRFCEIHVWDRHGQLVHEDAVPGLGILDGVGIDRGGNIYTMMQSVRMLDGRPYENGKTGTLAKFPPGRARLFSTGTGDQKDDKLPVPLPESQRPGRPSELNRFWVDGAEWFYGAVGHCMRATGGCNCWHSRFALDYYARSFAPETERYSVAVLDTNGNLITRIGQYGNLDDEGIGLIYPAYTAVHSDRRLFVSDAGNARIASVTLGYHAEVRVALKDMAGGER